AVATASGALRIWVSATASPHALAIYGTGSAAYEITGATSHADTITGGSGNDTLNAGAGDSMDGADGSDRYVFTRKAHLNGSVIDDSGATGTDTVLIDLDYYLDPPADGPIVVDQQLGGIEKIQVNADLATTQIFEFDFSSQDQGYTFSSNANVVGDPAKRTGRIEIYGTEHGDRFEAGTQGHRYVGGAGDDTFAGANAGSRYEGGDGEDVVWLDATYAIPGTWSGIESVLLGNASTGATDGTAAINLRAGGSAQALAITGNNGVNAITGTNFDDSISGNGGSDVISAGGGNDTIEGGAGADQMLGGAGDDVFLGLGGGDRINGNIGTDTLMLAGAGEALDLTALFNTALRSVETIDITGSGANSLKLDFDDVKYNLGAGGTLHVVADADDDVALAGDWTNLGSEGTVTSYSATSRGQTVFVEVDQAAAAGLTIFAVDGPDSISGGTGNDTVVFEDGTFDFSDDFADAGDGTDTLVVDGTLVNMFEGTFVSFEKVEVRDGANLFVNNETLEISATSGDNTTRLGNNAAQTYLGNDGADTVHLGAAGQSVDTGMGDDILRSTPARLVGSTLTAGEGFDTLMIEGNGAADLGELAGSLADLERIEVVSVGISSLTLSDEGFDVVLQHPLTVESGDGDDKFIFLSTNLFQSATVTLNNFTAGGDDDIIQLLLTDLGAYVGEVGAAGVDAALAGSAGLKDVVFDTDNSRLIVDINMDDAYGAGDLTIQLTGVTDLTVGLDLLMGA
ncbi:MAG TPA: calcium-binding protein, partial [Burkholderiales bacterium]|nr:calcium-binding protein [Burkholderiales bacterium]